MSSIAIRRPRIRSLPPGLAKQIAGGLAVAALAIALITVVAAQGPLSVLAVLFGVGGIWWLATTRHTLLALAVFMVYVGVLDGYLKLATGVSAVTLLRDALLFVIVIGLLVRALVRGRQLAAPPLSIWVGGFVVLVLVQLLNPQGGTLAHSLGGVRQHLEFVPLFFLTFAFVRTTKALRGFVILLLLIAAANGVASWIQFNLTPDQFASWGPGYADRVLGKGDFEFSGRNFADQAGEKHTRPFGLGSDIGSGGVVGALALGGIIALASLAGRRRYLLFAVAMAIAATTAIVTSQGRGIVVGSVVVVLSYALLTATARGRAGGLVGLAVAGIVALFVTQALIGSAGSSPLRFGGLTASNLVQQTSEARPGNTAAIATAVIDYPLGAGLGTAGPASSTAGETQLTHTVNAESELAFMTLETGAAGMLLITAFTVMLFALGVTRLRHEPDREARVLLTGIIAPIGGMIALYYPSSLTATTPTAPYLWAVAGIVSYWLIARPAQRLRAATP